MCRYFGASPLPLAVGGDLRTERGIGRAEADKLAGNQPVGAVCHDGGGGGHFVNDKQIIALVTTVAPLAPGKQADLLLVNATDYRQLAYQFGGNLVEAVVKNGSLCF